MVLVSCVVGLHTNRTDINIMIWKCEVHAQSSACGKSLMKHLVRVAQADSCELLCAACLSCSCCPGWSYKRSGGLQVWREGAVEVVGIPYSEHSSWNDLRDCVAALRPKKIIPTVNAANPGELTHDA